MADKTHEWINTAISLGVLIVMIFSLWIGSKRISGVQVDLDKTKLELKELKLQNLNVVTPEGEIVSSITSDENKDTVIVMYNVSE